MRLRRHSRQAGCGVDAERREHSGSGRVKLRLNGGQRRDVDLHREWREGSQQSEDTERAAGHIPSALCTTAASASASASAALATCVCATAATLVFAPCAATACAATGTVTCCIAASTHRLGLPHLARGRRQAPCCSGAAVGACCRVSVGARRPLHLCVAPRRRLARRSKAANQMPLAFPRSITPNQT